MVDIQALEKNLQQHFHELNHDILDDLIDEDIEETFLQYRKMEVKQAQSNPLTRSKGQHLN